MTLSIDSSVKVIMYDPWVRIMKYKARELETSPCTFPEDADGTETLEWGVRSGKRETRNVKRGINRAKRAHEVCVSVFPLYGANAMRGVGRANH